MAHSKTKCLSYSVYVGNEFAVVYNKELGLSCPKGKNCKIWKAFPKIFLAIVNWPKLSMKDRNKTFLRRFKASIRRKDLSKLVRDDACKGCHLCNS